MPGRPPLPYRFTVAVLTLGMTLVAALVAAATVSLLYDASYEDEARDFEADAAALGTLMDSVARFDSLHSGADDPEGAWGATMRQIRHGLLRMTQHGSGEIVVARRIAGGYEIWHRIDAAGSHPEPLRLTEEHARGTPLEHGFESRASGSGSFVDYAGQEVIAGYAYVPTLDVVVVRKVALLEFRADYERAALYAALVGLATILLGAIGVHLVATPLTRSAEAHERLAHRAAEQVRASEARLREAQRLAKIGSWEWTPATAELTPSDELVHLLELDSARGRDGFLDAFSPVDRDVVRAALAGGTIAERSGESIHRLRSDPGRARWGQLRWHADLGADGAPARVRGTVQDITAVHEAEQALRALTADLEQRVEARTRALREAHDGLLLEMKRREEVELELRQAQKLEAVGRLASGVAHEINTPTQYVSDNAAFLDKAIRSLAAVLEEAERVRAAGREQGVLGPPLDQFEQVTRRVKLGYLLREMPRALLQAREGLEQISSIVKSMKDFSHPSAGDMEPADLAGAVRSTTVVARNEWKLVAELDVECEPDLPPVECRRDEINQVVLGLVVNAAHAIGDVVRGTEAKGRITVGLARDGAGVLLRVRDTGTGIPEAIRGQVFDPFFTTKEVGRGAGQGLSTARRIVVDKHGGRIWLESEVGRGTTFFVWLPLRQARSEAA